MEEQGEYGMGVVAVVGAQWGDEGKGKVVGYLARSADVVARYSGGANAGHTVVVAGHEFKLHQVPTGILFSGTLALVGNGAVVDPPLLLQELEQLKEQGVRVDGLRLSHRAHVVMPYHRLLDRLQEEARGAGRIGTTGLGIGPAYADKVGREGIRLAELVEPQALARRLREVVPHKNRLLERVYGHPPVDVDALIEEYTRYGQALKPMVTDTSSLLTRAIHEGRRVLLEGAQGTLLDLDQGTYPYVTSSTTTAGGAPAGLGIAPWRVRSVVGVTKAYATRVGEGPFPTEQPNEVGEYLRRRGREYGTTTGRPRRCGWLDLVVVRWAVQVNGMTSLAVTLLDVLSGLPEVCLGVAYRRNDRVLTEVPATLPEWEQCEPVYEVLPGWTEDLSGCRRWQDLPSAARRYVERIEEVTGVPVCLVSVGREVDATICRFDPMAEACRG